MNSNNSQQTKNTCGVHGRYRIITRNDVTREVIRVTNWIDNLVMANTLSGGHGVNLITQRLIGLKVYDIEITQAKIGTGTNVPASTDTDLQTAVVSNVPRAFQSATATTAIMQFFINDATLPNGTYTEFGLFCGTQIFARSIISPSYTKATAEDSTFEYDITVTPTT